MRSLSLVSRLLDKLKYIVFKQELVGIDQLGNKYYRYPDTNMDGKAVEKRIIDLRQNEYNPEDIPPEWSAWLHRYRDVPPTDIEIEGMKQARAEMKVRVAALDEEERKRQLRIESLQSQGLSADAGPDMTAFVQQLAAKGYGGQSANLGTQNKPVSDHGESSTKFEPASWKPGKP